MPGLALIDNDKELGPRGEGLVPGLAPPRLKRLVEERLSIAGGGLISDLLGPVIFSLSLPLEAITVDELVLANNEEMLEDVMLRPSNDCRD